MANINKVVKNKQYLWAGIAICFVAVAVGGGWYISEMKIKSDRMISDDEPAPDLTGVVDASFNEKVSQHAISQTQALQEDVLKRFNGLEKELALLNKGRAEDKIRIENLAQENKRLNSQLSELEQKQESQQSTISISSPFAPEGEPSPTQFPPITKKGQVPLPSTFYPGVGTPPPSTVNYEPTNIKGQINRQTFKYDKKENKKKYPYIPSGSFVKSILIEGADANASVTGNTATVPMQVRLVGKVEMPNSKTYDLAGCFVSMEAYGDVSSERAIVRTRRISCIKGDDVIDLPIAGHVSFMGKNGIRGEVVMRNGKILGWAWGSGFIDGIGQGVNRATQPTVGIGATASIGGGDILKSGIGGGASKAAQTLSDYYIKRAEQYHPVIPIGAGNEVTVVFQDGFQIKTIQDIEEEKNMNKTTNKIEQRTSENINGFSTDQVLNQLGQLDPRQFIQN